MERGGQGRRTRTPTPYALRHTFASFAIAAGIPTFAIARMMGSSIEQIEETHSHLLPDALERGRSVLEAFDRAQNEALRRRMGAEDRESEADSLTKKPRLAGLFSYRGAEI